jgi:uncharacterized protein
VVGRGDIASIVDQVTDDVDWAAQAASHAAPWYGTRTGRPGVASFFSDFAASIEILTFEPHSFAVSEDAIHLLEDFTIRSLATGREAATMMHHYWRLREG